MGAQRASGLAMDWKAVSETVPAGLSSPKLSNIDGGWVSRELECQSSNSRLTLRRSNSPSGTGKAFRFRSLSPGDSTRAPPGTTACVPRSPRSLAAARRGASPPRGGELRGLAAGEMVEVVRTRNNSPEASPNASPRSSPRTSPRRLMPSVGTRTTASPKAITSPASPASTPANATEFRRRYDSGELPVHLIQKPDGSPARLIWTVDIHDVNLQKYLPVFVDGLREKEDPYRFVAVEGATSLLDCCGGHQVLPVVPQLILPMKVALSSRDPQVVMTVMKVLQHLLLVGVPSEVLIEARKALPPSVRAESGSPKRKILDGQVTSPKQEAAGTRRAASESVKARAASSLAQAVAVKAEADAEAHGDPSGDALRHTPPPSLGEKSPWRWGVSQKTSEFGAARLFPFYLMTPHAAAPPDRSSVGSQGSHKGADTPKSLRRIVSAHSALQEEMLALENISSGKRSNHRALNSSSLSSLPSPTEAKQQEAPPSQLQRGGAQRPGTAVPPSSLASRKPSPSPSRPARAASPEPSSKPCRRASPAPRSSVGQKPAAARVPAWAAPSPQLQKRPAPSSSPKAKSRSTLSGEASEEMLRSAAPGPKAVNGSRDDAAARLSMLGQKLERSLQNAERSVAEDVQLLEQRRAALYRAAALPPPSESGIIPP